MNKLTMPFIFVYKFSREAFSDFLNQFQHMPAYWIFFLPRHKLAKRLYCDRAFSYSYPLRAQCILPRLICLFTLCTLTLMILSCNFWHV